MCEYYICKNCVYNDRYAVNTPKPCIHCDCDICENGDMEVQFCNHHLTIEDINAIIEASRKEG